MSKENAELISMFAKTRGLVEKAGNRENAMCTAVLEGAECYCNAIFLLLNSNHMFPAMALTRCLCELAVKSIWCLRCPDDTDNEQDRETVDEKICRWEKIALKQMIKVLEEWKKVDPHDNKIDAEIKRLEEKKNDMKNIEEMPDYAKLLEKLPPDFRRISLELYKGFNKSVHLDANSLGEICSLKNKTNVEKIERVKNGCFVLAKIITGTIAINCSGDGPES